MLSAEPGYATVDLAEIVGPTGEVVALELSSKFVRAHQERFREHVIENWCESGGEPDSAPLLPSLLAENGFVIRSAAPDTFCIRPTD
jgi:hypothetical protein